MEFREFFEKQDISEYQIISLYNNPGVSIREISKSTGRSIGDIYRILEKHGVNSNRRAVPHHEITKNFLNHMKVDDVAKLMNLSKRQIYNIKKKP